MTAPAIILSYPQLGENVGSTARAMKNFGLTDLRLVNPGGAWPNPRAEALAVHATDVLAASQTFGDLKKALGDLHLVYATSARDRGVTKEVMTPAEAAKRLRAAAARGEKTGILFGNERAGLDNEEISLADAVITIPTSDFASINLGQAVLLIGYEWFKAADETPAARIEHPPFQRKPTREELFGLFEHLERELNASGFLFPMEKQPPMIRAIRATIHRSHLTYQEVQTIRGMIVALSRGKHRVNRA